MTISIKMEKHIELLRNENVFKPQANEKREEKKKARKRKLHEYRQINETK